MKKLLSLIILFTIILSFTTPREYKFTEGQAIAAYQYPEITQDVLINSDLPSKQVQQLLKTSDSIRKVIGIQYQKFNADTTKKR